jgi:hypothetical protein
MNLMTSRASHARLLAGIAAGIVACAGTPSAGVAPSPSALRPVVSAPSGVPSLYEAHRRAGIYHRPRPRRSGERSLGRLCGTDLQAAQPGLLPAVNPRLIHDAETIDPTPSGWVGAWLDLTCLDREE